jgi:hypothetical protein
MVTHVDDGDGDGEGVAETDGADVGVTTGFALLAAPDEVTGTGTCEAAGTAADVET